MKKLSFQPKFNSGGEILKLTMINTRAEGIRRK